MTMALLAVFAVSQLAASAEHCAPIAAAAPAEHSHAHGHAHEHAVADASITHVLTSPMADEALMATALSVCGAVMLLLVGLAVARLVRQGTGNLLGVLPRSLLPQPVALLVQRLPWTLSLDQLAISRT